LSLGDHQRDLGETLVPQFFELKEKGKRKKMEEKGRRGKAATFTHSLTQLKKLETADPVGSGAHQPFSGEGEYSRRNFHVS